MRGIATTILSFAVLLCACGGGKESNAVQFGVITSETGSANIGAAWLLSMQLAVDEINGAGGVLGRPLVLVIRDDHSRAEDAIAAGREFVEVSHLPVIFAQVTTNVISPIAAISATSDVVVLSDLGHRDPTFAGDQDDIFTTTALVSKQGAALAARAIEKGFKTCAVVAAPIPYGAGFAAGFVDAFGMAGGTTSANLILQPDLTSYQGLLDSVYAAGNPDCIMLAALSKDSAQLISDYLSAFSSKNTFWFLTPALGNPDFGIAVGASNFTFRHEGIDSNPGPGADAFMAAFQSANPTTELEPEPGAYDDVAIAALAIQKGGKDDADTVKANIRSLSEQGGAPVAPGHFKDAISALAAKGTIDYLGASGPLKFEADGTASSSYFLWAYVNGSYTVIAPQYTP
jgi:branched-chain amino acid transport system substrate-binding protein